MILFVKQYKNDNTAFHWNSDVSGGFALEQGWGTYGPRAKCGQGEHLIWPATEFSLPI